VNFDFGPGIGKVPLMGLPSGPYSFDTIVQRQRDANLPAVGSSDTVPIEIVWLSLQSVSPVSMGLPYLVDVFVGLTPGMHSTVEMTINHENADNGTPDPEGTFTSFFDVFFDIEIAPVGGGQKSLIRRDMMRLETALPGLWSHEPPPSAFLVIGPPGDQKANKHVPLPQGFDDFFIVGIDGVMEVHPGVAQHNAKTTVVPEPSTMLMLSVGLGGLLFCRPRKE
jgi:hypothetical protein